MHKTTTAAAVHTKTPNARTHDERVRLAAPRLPVGHDRAVVPRQHAVDDALAAVGKDVGLRSALACVLHMRVFGDGRLLCRLMLLCHVSCPCMQHAIHEHHEHEQKKSLTKDLVERKG